MEKVKRFGVSLKPHLLEKLDKMVREKGYPNRSKVIRDLIRDFLVEEEWRKNERVVGTITVVYNHKASGIGEAFRKLQHSHHKNILSMTHVHIDEDMCLEVLVLKGRARKLKEISDRLLGTRGILHGKLVCTSLGRNL
ncbi:MAG: nickel-responsive transcriptional regulator NikR [Candidatus Methanofastidiosia archaeon]